MPIKPSTMWPALIFAASRNDRVIGRTIILDDSIKTKNGFSQSGAPSGRRWAIVALIDLSALDIISSIHIGRAILRVNNRWLVTLKVYGNNPSIFSMTTMKKI